MVADGALDFGEGAFGLSELVNAALGTRGRPWEELIITTAHRSDTEVVAQIKGFRFDAAPHNIPFSIEHYDQVWLFGHVGQDPPGADPPNELSQRELRLLAEFMEAGGGVFATGDHEDMGFALCARVPRVRSMRKWFWLEPLPPDTPRAPSGSKTDRLDTLREGRDPGFQSTDQSDDVPQEIRPRFFKGPGDVTSYPHPLLCLSGDKAIKITPDHPHEGECVVPTKLTESFAFDGAEPADEYPPLPGSDERLAPTLVAISSSAAGFLKDKMKPPVDPRCFYTIVAYDGHCVSAGEDGHYVGRVVTDATWHHFINLNLKGFRDAAGNPTPEYEVIKQYFRNIAAWLSPKEKQLWRCLNLLVGIRYTYPLIEEVRRPPAMSLTDLLAVGSKTVAAVSEIFTSGEARECTLTLLGLLPEKFHSALRRLCDPWLTPERQSQAGVLLRHEALVEAINGGAMLAIAHHLPEDPYQVDAKSLALTGSEVMDSPLVPLIREGVQFGFDALVQAVGLFVGELHAEVARLRE